MARYALLSLAALGIILASTTARAEGAVSDRGCGLRALVIDGVAGLRTMGVIGSRTNASQMEETDVAIKTAIHSCGGTVLLRAPATAAPRGRWDAALGLSARLIAPVLRSFVAAHVDPSLAPIMTTVPFRAALSFAVDDVVAWAVVFPKGVRELGLRPPRVAVGRDNVQLWISAQF